LKNAQGHPETSADEVQGQESDESGQHGRAAGGDVSSGGAAGRQVRGR